MTDSSSAETMLAEVLQALEDLSFECDGAGTAVLTPSRETYDRTFRVLDATRKKLNVRCAGEYKPSHEPNGARIRPANCKHESIWLVCNDCGLDLRNTTLTPPPNDELVAAARAVVARWETPAWKVAPATAGYIYALRDALDRYAHQAPAAARNHVAWLIESIDNGKAYWWRGSDFTDDANEAVRFSRREDADQVILERGMDDSFSAEHMWCDVPSPTKRDAP